MPKYKLTEGEARLLVAVFFHLDPYYKQAKANHTSVADEMYNDNEEILGTYYELLERALIVALTARERVIIKQRYGLSEDRKCYTLEEIAREFDVTRERIRQVEAIALKKIHHYMTELNDEETDKVIHELQADVQEYSIDAARAHVAEDSDLEEMYNRCLAVGTSAMNKLKIQQNIRKHREGTV